MMHRPGPRLTPAQKTEVWRRWRQGESLSAIGRALGRIPKLVHYIVAGAGGVAPSPRQRSRLALTLAEREEISRGLAHGYSLRAIGRGLGRAPSTVSREVRRHGGRHRYRAADADRRAWKRSRRPKRCRLATSPALRDVVATQLACEWSPQQIAGWLRQTYPDDPTMRVSHETIYLSLFVQSRGVLKKALLAHLRHRRLYRRPQTQGAHPGGHIVDPISIRARPAAAEDRAVPGHWEGDLLVGGRHSYLATLVERRSRYVCLVRVTGKETHTVVRALTRHVQRLPAGLMTTLTWDRGLELAAHRTFSIATGVQVYFCDPQSPWQRGTNENTNGLLRQYFPRGTNLARHSRDDLEAVALALNTRPRKTLGWRTPAEALDELLVSAS
ncbi:MAG: IS30 family transposase [Planctomycetes bacterium]|nr:IS30 family transposase [Planctomycetota bacterium]